MEEQIEEFSPTPPLPRPPIPVIILSGFLGAGKTTVLNHWLSQFQDQKTLVIENEFGDVGIDGKLLYSAIQGVEELSNGCICCSLNEALFDVLADISQLELPPLRIIIETTGIADPGSLAAIFIRPDVAAYFEVQALVTVIDAEQVIARLKDIGEIHRQIALADLLILNRAAEKPSDDLEKILRAINPLAPILPAPDGHVSLADIPLHRLQFPMRFMIPPQGQPLAHEMNSFSLIPKNVFDPRALLHSLNMAMVMYYEQIYRIKGFVWVAAPEEPTGKMPCLLQTTGNRTSLTPVNEILPDYPDGLIVCIGRGLQPQAMERIFKAAYHPYHVS
jgi:G3E family GTPase